MKKNKKKLSLEKINIARLTVNMHRIFGGGRTVYTDECYTAACQTHECTSTTCTTDPQSDSSLECGMVGITDDCQTQQVGCIASP